METEKVASFKNVFQHLAGKITKVSFVINAQAISQTVLCFDHNPIFESVSEIG